MRRATWVFIAMTCCGDTTPISNDNGVRGAAESASAAGVMTSAPNRDTVEDLPFPTGAFERPATLPAASKWAWPDLAVFRKRFGDYSEAKTTRLVHADVRLRSGEERVVESAYLVVRPHGEARFEFEALAPHDAGSRLGRALELCNSWQLVLGDLEGRGPAATRARCDDAGDFNGLELTLDVRSTTPSASVRADAWTAWVYASVLLEWGPPAWIEHPLPIGTCSMDQAPREAAAGYAKQCFSEHDLGCFLQFQVLLMGDGFKRVAYSSMAQRINGTSANDLAKSGIDVPRFFAGLLIEARGAPARRLNVPLYRLGRAIAEAGRSDEMMAILQRLAEDRHLDDWNRTRAALAIAYLLSYGAAPFRSPQAALATVGQGWSLTPAARAWMESDH
jgi:hypothetical protein